MKFFALSVIVALSSPCAWSQTDMDAEIENEVQAVDPLQRDFIAEPPSQTQKKKSIGSSYEEEQKIQNQVLQRKKKSENEVSADRNTNRYPKAEPLFERPPGPPNGGAVRVEHPRAAEGLLRVNRDGSYQYRTTLKDKSKSSSVKIGSMTPPKISVDKSAVTYESMYGSSNMISVLYNYEWQPFRSFGALGLVLETGFATASAKGSFKNQNRADKKTSSEEKYNFFVVPATAMLNYRFEFVRRQWVVPFINGGGTYYGLAEVRDDGKRPAFAGAPAVFGGGGLLFSISRLDAAGAFALSSEYGIADMWFLLEARATQGLYSDTDFSGQSINGGITVDF